MAAHSKNHNLIPTNDKDIQTLIWFSNGFYSVTESAERGVFIFKDLRYPLMMKTIQIHLSLVFQLKR